MDVCIIYLVLFTESKRLLSLSKRNSEDSIEAAKQRYLERKRARTVNL